MKKILKLLYSTRLTAILFVVFASAMAIATFIENDFGTQTARAVVYDAWWFELIMILFVINFIGNIFNYKLYKRKKWPTLIFHLAFIIIIIGAGITRYISYSGIMPIKEGETSNIVLSDRAFLKVEIDDGKQQKSPIYKHLELSALGNNKFSINSDFKGESVKIKFINYIPHAVKKLVANKNGTEFLHFVESSGGQRHDHYIKKGSVLNVNNVLVSFNNPVPGGINFLQSKGVLNLEAPQDGNFFRMADQFRGKILKDSVTQFQLRSLYTIGNLQFVVPALPSKGVLKTVSGNKNQFPYDELTLSVTVKSKTDTIKITGGNYATFAPKQFSLNGLNFRVSYGSKYYKLPFSIKLRDFQLDRYPGSMSPKSYASEITVIDKDRIFNYRIFMNNVLDFKGFRFFQASYSITPQYEETRLSVNHDKWGTWVTYVGYAFLFLGLIVVFFNKNSRFSSLSKKLKKIKAKKAQLLILLLFSTGFLAAQRINTTEKGLDSIVKAEKISKIEASKFSHLVIQDQGGRMKPVNTFSSELLRKVSRNDTYRGLNSDQVVLSMLRNPRVWYYVPFIYLERSNVKIREILGVGKGQRLASFSDFFDAKGNYKLISYVNNASKKKIRNQFEKDLLSIDRRANLLYAALGGSIFRFFPLPNDKNNKWYAYPDVSKAPFKGMDSLYVHNAIPLYTRALTDAKNSGNYEKADEILKSISDFQKKYGAAVMPSARKINIEILYNKYDVFKSLFTYYLLASILMLAFVIIQIFKNSRLINTLIKLSIAFIALLFLAHTAGLGMRWYISGHAPWSNGYESMIYISWATMFFGLVFGRKSSMTIAATAFITSMMLFIAHLNFMDPAIANLVPVLDSYWLKIHVAIIVASYGPFSLGMILGLLALNLYVFTNNKNKNKIKLAINELTIITEMTLTVGLVMLTIGNFLGGMWANESWGRYWGWDPKETWALISIMIYAFVLHLRLIPGLKSKFTFNLMAVVSYASILMTYFGVNYYLSGLHSYAKGEPQKTPNFVYYLVIGIIVLGVLAFRKYKKYYKKLN